MPSSFLCGILAVGCVAVITIYMFLSGLPAIGKIGPLNFLFGTEWASTASEPKYGILPFVLSSIYGTLGASLIGVPVGLLTAVFLSKAAPPGVRNVVVTAVEPAERHPQRGVRSAGYAGAGACGGEGVWQGVGRLPAVGPSWCCPS